MLGQIWQEIVFELLLKILWTDFSDNTRNLALKLIQNENLWTS